MLLLPEGNFEIKPFTNTVGQPVTSKAENVHEIDSNNWECVTSRTVGHWFIIFEYRI